MRVSAALAPLRDLWLAIHATFLPILYALVLNPLQLLLDPGAVSRLVMAYMWGALADGADENGWAAKQSLIQPHARGVVLELGAGQGHSIAYLDRKLVRRYIALEPNVLFWPQIRERAAEAGFTEESKTLLMLPCGAEDVLSILSALRDFGGLEGVDTILSVMTLCSVPAPQRTIRGLVRDVLNPGGEFLFYEHVLSPRADVAWWQRAWTYVWRIVFDGCRLDLPTDVWFDELESVWAKKEVWYRKDESEEELFRHAVGRYVKA
ncbi:hypothetical protein PLICRDRAFT_57318 [Plicaturopsis crispa FD-325 SS-3]|uniref:S-adenosyl-L-methionine-dependent methyltransferase n=1 Tax=Plicaturopsis crispa FD-325 SS-3 TaxID=944288 RepID=A0A0C9T650_PLICR|nr:hypothetical protein PLICRDRAFT_57318 [Plicaturopsis crispa FD-325 SS-3]